MDKILKKPKALPEVNTLGKYEPFSLKENPFPANPYVNRESSDDRINGKIYNELIRKKESEHITRYFLESSQFTPSHLRLGYIIDESYVGRGNGKSAFLVNLIDKINKNFCLDISNEINKCFGIYIQPKPGGNTKSFDSIIDLIFEGILKNNIISYCLAILRLEAILNLQPNFDSESAFSDESDLINKLNSPEWFRANEIELRKINEVIFQNKYLASLPMEFPLYTERNTLFARLVTQQDFENHYLNLRKGSQKLDFAFSHLVSFFLAAGFNGAYLFIDDFERIPDFQSSRQKRDFALELRTSFFDGMYENAKIGFYNLFLVIHAGVPRLIEDAWSDSGMERRSPILTSENNAHHIIPFRKLTQDDAKTLISEYISKYRIANENIDSIHPFTSKAINKIAESQELNAAAILRLCHELIENLVESPNQKIIDDKFINQRLKGKEGADLEKAKGRIKDTGIDLIAKAKTTKTKKKRK